MSRKIESKFGIPRFLTVRINCRIKLNLLSLITKYINIIITFFILFRESNQPKFVLEHDDMQASLLHPLESNQSTFAQKAVYPLNSAFWSKINSEVLKAAYISVSLYQ